jgi:hypothetical protein
LEERVKWTTWTGTLCLAVGPVGGRIRILGQFSVCRCGLSSSDCLTSHVRLQWVEYGASGGCGEGGVTVDSPSACPCELPSGFLLLQASIDAAILQSWGVDNKEMQPPRLKNWEVEMMPLPELKVSGRRALWSMDLGIEGKSVSGKRKVGNG